MDDVFYPNDSLVHEEIAREIAYLISNGDWRVVRHYWGFGNEGYRFVLGCFYALTNAPELTTYGVHGLLGFAGMLSVLQTVCQHAGSRRVPMWVVLYCVASPSAIFWTTFNLKEGAMLWGLCMLLRTTVRFSGVDRSDSLVAPALGVLVAGFLRPHITIAYLFALAVGYSISRRQIGMLLVSALGIVVAVAMLRTMAPVMFERFVTDGIRSTLDEKFGELSQGDGSVITYFYGTPIPVISGYLLINFRPFPWEVHNITTFAPGVEVWLISAAGFLGWLHSPHKRKLFLSAYVITILAALFALSFYFSYMYNMGLMVRQRLMVFPILIPLAVLPTLVALGPSATSRTSLPAQSMPPGTMMRPSLRVGSRKRSAPWQTAAHRR